MRKLILLLSIFYFSNSFCQVNLQTGSATFGLPIFSWQDNKSNLHSEISIDYNSGMGLLVNEVASNIGQGWNLNGGGIITRIQVGEPDDQMPRDAQDLSQYPAGFLYDVPIAKGCANALTKYPLYKDEDHLYKEHNSVAADKELDHFNFHFNGRSGVFVLGRNSYGSLGPVFLGDTKLKIWFDKNEAMTGIRTTISAFHIQDEKGLIYTFSQLETSQLLKVRYLDKNFNAQYTQPTFEDGEVYYESMFPDASIVKPNVVNSWYLTDISDPFTAPVSHITFSYLTRQINTPAGATISNNTENQSKNYSIISYSTAAGTTPVISTITFPDVDPNPNPNPNPHVVQFNYQSTSRYDLNGDRALASIDITYQGRTISKYILNTSYFIFNHYGIPKSDNEKNAARLCLLSVQKIGVDLNDDEQPYTFDYYLGSGTAGNFVPPPFFHLKDIWGYYNGDYSVDFGGTPISFTKDLANLTNNELKGLCFLRSGTANISLKAKPGYAQNGLLKQVNNPGGSSIKFTYVQNKGVINSQTIDVGGVHVSQTGVTDGGYNISCTTPMLTNYKYQLDASGTSSLWGLEQPVNTITSQNYYKPFVKKWRPKVPFGECIYKYQNPGILSRDQQSSITPSQKFLASALDILGQASTVYDAINLIFISSGAGAIAAVVMDVISGLYTVFSTCVGDHSKNFTSVSYYNRDLNSINPLPSQFKRVEVIENGGLNGQTVHEFTSNTDFPFWYVTNPLFTQKQRYASWAYGLESKTTVKDANGNPVKEIEYNYDPTYIQRPYACKACPGDYLSYKAQVIKSSSQKSTDWDSPVIYDDPLKYTEDIISNTDMKVDPYNVYTGRVELLQTIERNYRPGTSGLFASTVTDFKYNNSDYKTIANYEVNEIITTESNGDVKHKYIKYNSDYSAGVLYTLNTNNVFALPVESATSIIKAGTSQQMYLNENVTEFLATGNGAIKPYQTLEQRFNKPQATIQFYDNPGSNINPAYIPTQTLHYDPSGNLDVVSDEGNHVVSNIYDYNDKYVVASVINADNTNSLEAAYTSFETPLLGGWQLTGSSVKNTTSAVTGSSSFILSSGKSLKATIHTTKSYRLSFWGSGGTVSVAGGATLVKSAPVINGFTYYEYTISQGTSTVTVTGTGNIDELRICPQDARMRTVTYDPLIGKTSECDENNRITYYEYDELGRLRFIKDENKNIVKMNEYNIKQKGCPGNYANLAITEIFTRSNCAAGYEGGTYTYTIPSSTYTSTISQLDADMQAQAELDNLGQSAANSTAACNLLYYNDVKTGNFSKQSCADGYKSSGTVAYTVAANKYSSLISKADANQQAQDDVDANGQAYVNNTPGVGSCIIDNAAEWLETGYEYCQGGNKILQIRDANTNSPTYNQTQNTDIGPDASCSGTSCSFSAASGFGLDYSTLSSNNGVATFTLVFHSISGTANWSFNNQVAVINSGCIPSANRTLSMSENGRTWQVTIYSSGSVSVLLLSGTAPTGTYVIGLSGGTYNL